MKSTNTTKVNNTVSAILFLQSSLPASVTDEIYDVLAKTPFDKLNVNIAVPRKFIEETDENDTRTYMTAGTVKSYDPETKEFKIRLLYGTIADTLKSFEDKIVTLNVKTYTKNRVVHLSKITKIVIEPAPSFNKEPVKEEKPQSEENVVLLEDAVVVKDEATVENNTKVSSLGNTIVIPDSVKEAIKE